MLCAGSSCRLCRIRFPRACNQPTNQPTNHVLPLPQPTNQPTNQRPATAKPATPEVHKPTAKHATTELAQVNCEASNYRTAQINCEVCKYRISTNQTLPGRLSVTCRTQRRVEKVRFGSNTKNSSESTPAAAQFRSLETSEFHKFESIFVRNPSKKRTQTVFTRLNRVSSQNSC